MLLLPLISCGDPVESAPEEPTWFADVQPLIIEQCASCHGPVPADTSIDDFRLDRYVKDDADSFDAYDYRELIVQHAALGVAPVMPLDGELSAVDKQILERWLEQGAPKGTRDNALPSVERVLPGSASATADQELAIAFLSSDADGDGLIIELGYRNLDSSAEVIVRSDLLSGMSEVQIDTGLLRSLGHFQVFVRVDDGYSDDPAQNSHETILLEDLLVDHGVRGTAPTVEVLSPNGGGTVIGETTITWNAVDPDEGDVLSIDIDLLELDSSGQVVATQSLATGLPNAPASFVWDASGVPAEQGATAIPYKIRVSATDTGGLNTRSDTSDAAFNVASGGSTDLDWGDIGPIFQTYCSACHGQPAKTMALEYFRLDKYDAADPAAPSNADIGVFEMRSLVYQRLVVNGSMPPITQTQPSQSEIDQIAEWILAGAPFGNTGDQPPSFSWISPNNSATTQVGSADITIEWNALDPEGQPLSGSILMAELAQQFPPLNPATASCDGTESGYVEVVASSAIEDNSAAITLPNSGFFCFKASVSDASGQTVNVTAGRPVAF